MYYGVELSDVFLRKVSFRKAGVYIERLPPESATMTAIRLDAPEAPASNKKQQDPDADRMPWSSDQMLVAQLIDEVRNLTYIIKCITAGKNQNIPPPEQVQRPGVKPTRARSKGKRMMTREQIMQLDPRMRAGSGYKAEDGRDGSV